MSTVCSNMTKKIVWKLQMLHSENKISIYVLFVYKSWTLFYLHSGPSSVQQREKKDMLLCLWWVWLNFYYGLPLLFIEMTRHSSSIINVAWNQDGWDCDWNRMVLSLFSSNRENWAMFQCPALVMSTKLYSQSMSTNNICRRWR